MTIATVRSREKEWLIGCGWMKNDGKHRIFKGKEKVDECTEGKK